MSAPVLKRTLPSREIHLGKGGKEDRRGEKGNRTAAAADSIPSPRRPRTTPRLPDPESDSRLRRRPDAILASVSTGRRHRRRHHRRQVSGSAQPEESLRPIQPTHRPDDDDEEEKEEKGTTPLPGRGRTQPANDSVSYRPRRSQSRRASETSHPPFPQRQPHQSAPHPRVAPPPLLLRRYSPQSHSLHSSDPSSRLFSER